MKRFFFLSFILIAFAFVAPTVSGSNSPPPYQLTVSLGQQQLDQVATINTQVEQNVTFTYKTVSYAYQARAVMHEIAGYSNLPQPPNLYSTAAPGATTFNFLSEKSCIRPLICFDVSKKALIYCYNLISMRQLARDALMSNNGSYNWSFNPNALIRML